MKTEIIHEKQDLTHLSWSLIRSSSGTAGSFLKATSEFGDRKIYYKLSNFDSVNGIVGHECANEIIADKLLTVLGVDHLHYQLIHADINVQGQTLETYLCASEDFKQRGEDKVALDVFYELERQEGETPLAFCVRNEWADYIYQMLVVDFLLLNRDRHGANIEVLRNTKKRTIRLAPIFDHGLSLLFNCHDEDAVRSFDVMQDKQIQCFVSSRSAQENLMLIPGSELPALRPLRSSDREFILGGLDPVLPKLWRDRIWEMIERRWQYYESFCNQRRTGSIAD